MTAQRITVTPDSVYGELWAQRLSRLPGVSPEIGIGVGAGDVVLVVGAHPDDETFGFGASMATLSAAGVYVHALSLSCGEAALDHVDATVDDLGGLRTDEYTRACRTLGTTSSTVAALPDSRLSDHRDAISHIVAEKATQVDANHVVTVWWGDPHPDHQAVGRASLAAADVIGCRVSAYPVWALHWSDPTSSTIEALRLRPMRNDANAEAVRRLAVQCYRSQTESLREDLEPVLPQSLVRWTPEILVTG